MRHATYEICTNVHPKPTYVHTWYLVKMILKTYKCTSKNNICTFTVPSLKRLKYVQMLAFICTYLRRYLKIL